MIPLQHATWLRFLSIDPGIIKRLALWVVSPQAFVWENMWVRKLRLRITVLIYMHMKLSFDLEHMLHLVLYSHLAR